MAGNRQKVTRLTRFGGRKLVSHASPPFTHSAKRIQDLEALLSQKESEIGYLSWKNDYLTQERKETHARIDLEAERACLVIDELDEWIGKVLKCKFLVDKIKDIAGDPLAPTAEDIFECFDDIEVREVNEEVWRKHIPTRLQEWPEEEWEEFLQDESESEDDMSISSDEESEEAAWDFAGTRG